MHPSILCSAGITTSRTVAQFRYRCTRIAPLNSGRARVHDPPLSLFGAAPRWRHRSIITSSDGPAVGQWAKSDVNGLAGWRPHRRLGRWIPMCAGCGTPRAAALSISPTRRRLFCTAHDGSCNVFVPHATAGVAIIETGAGSDEDLVDTLVWLLPRDLSLPARARVLRSRAPTTCYRLCAVGDGAGLGPAPGTLAKHRSGSTQPGQSAVKRHEKRTKTRCA